VLQLKKIGESIYNNVSLPMQNWSICCKDEKPHSQLANVKVVTRKNRKAQSNTTTRNPCISDGHFLRISLLSQKKYISDEGGFFLQELKDNYIRVL
jgi:hypothetical protein